MLESKLPKSQLLKIDVKNAITFFLSELKHYSIKISAQFVYALTVVMRKHFNFLSIDIREFFENFKK